MQANILTYDNARPEGKTRGKSINWNDKSDRIWLDNHLTWAIHNNHTVIISAPSHSK